MRYISCLLFLVISVYACQKHSTTDITGTWKAIELTQEGDSLEIDLEDVSFEFKENGRYQFNSTLKYEEAGTFHVDGPYLFSIDTTQNMDHEKAVEIIQLSGDTLILRMEDLGNERVMVLRRAAKF